MRYPDRDFRPGSEYKEEMHLLPTFFESFIRGWPQIPRVVINEINRKYEWWFVASSAFLLNERKYSINSLLKTYLRNVLRPFPWVQMEATKKQFHLEGSQNASMEAYLNVFILSLPLRTFFECSKTLQSSVKNQPSIHENQ